MLIAAMTLPVAMTLIIILGAAYAHAFISYKHKTTIVKTALPYLMRLIFLFYPLVSKTAFDAFSCYDFLETAWLKADVAIQCGSSDHFEVMALAWVGVVLYPIGLLLLMALLLFRERHAIQANQPTPLSRAIAFVHRDYNGDYFWWEVHACRQAIPPRSSHWPSAPFPEPH